MAANPIASQSRMTANTSGWASTELPPYAALTSPLGLPTSSSRSAATILAGMPTQRPFRPSLRYRGPTRRSSSALPAQAISGVSNTIAIYDSGTPGAPPSPTSCPWPCRSMAPPAKSMPLRTTATPFTPTLQRVSPRKAQPPPTETTPPTGSTTCRSPAVAPTLTSAPSTMRKLARCSAHFYVAGSTVAQGPTVADTTLGRVFILDNPQGYVYSYGYTQIQTFNISDFNPLFNQRHSCRCQHEHKLPIQRKCLAPHAMGSQWTCLPHQRRCLQRPIQSREGPLRHIG